MKEVLLQKKESLERSISQARRYYHLPSELTFEEDFFKQDAIAMNLQRACECALDMATHLIRKKKLGLPSNSRESFELLKQAGLIEQESLELMKRMIGFRNILVHNYQQLDLNVVEEILNERLDDLIDFAQQLINHTVNNPSEEIQ